METVFYKIFKHLKTNYYEIINLFLTSIILIITIISFIYYQNAKLEYKKDYNEEIAYDDTEAEQKIDEVSKEITEVIVDIKGAVKKPGVYKIDNTSIINDVIKLAGGLTNQASTDNINLGKQVKNEMVIYISTKTELKKISQEKNTPISQIDTTTSKENQTLNIASQDTFVSSTTTVGVTENENNSDNNNQKEQEETETKTPIEETKININTATKEELLSLSGIGESKAEKIIIYRETNGNFITIEDIKKVSGIGDNLFEQIKDTITVG